MYLTDDKVSQLYDILSSVRIAELIMVLSFTQSAHFFDLRVVESVSSLTQAFSLLIDTDFIPCFLLNIGGNAYSLACGTHVKSSHWLISTKRILIFRPLRAPILMFSIRCTCR